MIKQKDVLKKFLAGIFFFVGILLIVVVVLVIGLEKGLTQSKFQIDVLFRDVGGLRIGAPTRLSGVDVGFVGRIDFLEKEIYGRSVKVTLNIYQRYKNHLEKSSRFSITTEGILGEKLVEIRIDENGQRIDLTKPIIGEDPLDVKDSAVVFVKTAESLTQTTESIKAMMDELQIISRKAVRLIDRVEQRIIEGNLFKLF